VLNVHVPEFQIYGEDTAFIYNNVQLCALKISVLITDYMFKVKYMYENFKFHFVPKGYDCTRNQQSETKKNCMKLKLYTYLYLSDV
jgi:hypothetical protein